MSAERIWVRLPNWLGDALMARPMLVALRARRPAARIRAIAPEPFLALLRAERAFDEEAAWRGESAARRALVSGLREFRADAALVLPPSFSSALEAWSSRAPRRIGFAGEARSPLLTDAWPRPPRGDLHLAAEYLALLDRLAPPDDAARAGAAADPLRVPPLALASEAVAAAAERRARLPEPAAPLVLIAPGARYGPAKRWHAERYADLARRLIARGHAVAVCGGAEERETCEGVASAAGAVSLAGETSLGELAGLCAIAAFTVSNDSGFAHLSAAVGTRTVVLFGSTSSAWTAPLGPEVRILQHAPVCSPCFQRRCRIGTLCLSAIGVDEVEAACLADAA